MADGAGKNFRGHRIGNRRLLDVAKAVVTIAGVLAFIGMGAGSAFAQTLVRNRITAPIRSAQMQAIHGTVHPLVADAQDLGQMSGSTTIQGMSLVFRLSAAQQADLTNLLQEQQTKGSSMYHRWLGPGQFAARYGMSASDLAKASAWLQSQGFQINDIPASAGRIDFSGTAAQVDAAFHTQMHRYSLHGQMHWANSTEISLPQAIAGIALGVRHLNSFRPLPHLSKRPVYVARQNAAASFDSHYTLCESATSPCPSGDTANFIAPSDSQTIYDVTGLYNSNITGAGQTMAVVGQTDIEKYKSDIANFRTLSGLNASNMPTQIVVKQTGSAAVSVGDLLEADIDVEWSGAIAKDATILYVTVGSNPNFNVFDSLIYAVQNPLVNNDTQFVPVISISYGGCEQQDLSKSDILQLDVYLEQANAQGQTVVASSGDDGSADCDDTDSSKTAASKGLAVDYPASSQYVTGVGGISFSGDLSDQSAYWSNNNNADNGSVLGYIPESVWNDTPTLADLTNPNIGDGQLSASGGGVSTIFSKPSWQVGSGVPGDGMRDVPDVALAADPNHDGYVLCTEETDSTGSLTGTSSCVYPVGSNQVPYFDAAGYGYLYGGTSIATPQMAAMITLWNQEAGNTAGVGNANPIFYLTAQNSPGAFHDVTTGSNAVVCKQGSPNCVSNGLSGSAAGYVMSCCSAGSGYDKATGLGSVDAAAMGAVWPAISSTTTNPTQPTFSMVSDSKTLTLGAGGSTNVTLVVTPNDGFTGTVALTCSNLPANTTCSFAPSASVIIASDTAQNVTLTLNNSASARLVAPHPFHRDWPMGTVLAGVFGLSLLGVGKKRRFPSRWASRWMVIFLLAAGLMAATALTACGGGSAGSSGGGGGTGPANNTSTITVTGTSTNTSVADHIQLTITT